MAPLLSLSVARPRGHRAKKKLWYVYQFLGKTRKKGIVPERSVCRIEASDLENEKDEGFHGGGVFSFLPCFSLPKEIRL